MHMFCGSVVLVWHTIYNDSAHPSMFQNLVFGLVL
jgi:hypothetical protein